MLWGYRAGDGVQPCRSCKLSHTQSLPDTCHSSARTRSPLRSRLEGGQHLTEVSQDRSYLPSLGM